jgi:hypothetical protein
MFQFCKSNTIIDVRAIKIRNYWSNDMWFRIKWEDYAKIKNCWKVWYRVFERWTEIIIC